MTKSTGIGKGRRPPSEIRIEGDSAFITLTRGYEAIVDVADLPLVAPYRWFFRPGASGHTYAGRSNDQQLLHRLLLNPLPGEMIDHINGNGLDNRRCNIRICDARLNQANKAVMVTNKLGVKGVERHKKMYRARINVGGRTIHLGLFLTPEEANAAYIGAAKVLFGQCARV